MTETTISTIGHSTHDIETFLQLLQAHGVTAVADVRSTPSSRFSPQFNRGALRESLRRIGVGYVFLGKELGARSDDPSCYVDGRVQYQRLAQSSAFEGGLQRLKLGARNERITIMCAEREPLDCHRTVLVAQALADRGARIEHIHGDGAIESHAAAMKRLMTMFGLADEDLFRTETERLSEALRRQEDRIAYVNTDFAMNGT